MWCSGARAFQRIVSIAAVTVPLRAITAAIIVAVAWSTRPPLDWNDQLAFLAQRISGNQHANVKSAPATPSGEPASEFQTETLPIFHTVIPARRRQPSQLQPNIKKDFE